MCPHTCSHNCPHSCKHSPVSLQGMPSHVFHTCNTLTCVLTAVHSHTLLVSSHTYRYSHMCFYTIIIHVLTHAHVCTSTGMYRYALTHTFTFSHICSHTQVFSYSHSVSYTTHPVPVSKALLFLLPQVPELQWFPIGGMRTFEFCSPFWVVGGLEVVVLRIYGLLKV